MVPAQRKTRSTRTPARAAAPDAGASGESGREDKPAALRKDAGARLQNLRSAARETSRVYLSKIEHDILELIDSVAASPARKGLTTRSLQKVLEVLENLSLKPEKGRRKDLRRIEEAIEEMRRHIEE
jgi:phage-related protein